jgi:hypothetical protein
VQQIDVLLAKEYLADNPEKSIVTLIKFEVDNLNEYPYYNLYAEALFKTAQQIKALAYMEKPNNLTNKDGIKACNNCS